MVSDGTSITHNASADVSLVWKRVPEHAVNFTNVTTNILLNEIPKYTPAQVSSAIQFKWEHKKQGSAIRVTNKQKATRSAFAAREVTLNGEGADSESKKKGTAKRSKRQLDKSQSSSTGKRQNETQTTNLGAPFLLQLDLSGPRKEKKSAEVSYAWRVEGPPTPSDAFLS